MNKSIYQTKEFRQKMSIIGKQRQERLWANPEYRLNQIEKLKASKRTDSFKINQSKAQKKRYGNPEERIRARDNMRSIPRAKGNQASGWKGGISTENERHRKSVQFRLWRMAVFARDSWTCQQCHKRGGTLHPHHIKPFAVFKKLRFVTDNGVTLCATCHKDAHQNNHFEARP